MLLGIFIVIFATCMALLYQDGMWGNAVRLINVVTAALLATNYFEPLAAYLDGLQPSYTYLWDFLALWGLFAVFLVVFRAATDSISKVQVRFLKIVDQVGSVVFSAWIGWVLICFTAFSLHLAPLGREFLGGSFKSEERVEGNGAELYWLGFVQSVSRGAFCRELSEAEATENKYASRQEKNPAEANLAVFDRTGGLLPKYATRRARLQSYVESTGAIRFQ
ncbi:MAG: CvpA family protein [Patescibacteria group bacterium]|nr:CvpA family protein [Patescibacteria group bacterium]